MAGNKRAASGAGTIRKKTVKRKGKEYTYWEARYTAGYDSGTGKQIQRSTMDACLNPNSNNSRIHDRVVPRPNIFLFTILSPPHRLLERRQIFCCSAALISFSRKSG